MQISQLVAAQVCAVQIFQIPSLPLNGPCSWSSMKLVLAMWATISAGLRQKCNGRDARSERLMMLSVSGICAIALRAVSGQPVDDWFFHQETTSSAHPSRHVWTILATLSLTRGVVSPVRVNQRHERSDHFEASSNQFFWRHGPSIVPGMVMQCYARFIHLDRPAKSQRASVETLQQGQQQTLTTSCQSMREHWRTMGL